MVGGEIGVVAVVEAEVGAGVEGKLVVKAVGSYIQQIEE